MRYDPSVSSVLASERISVDTEREDKLYLKVKIHDINKLTQHNQDYMYNSICDCTLAHSVS